MNDRPSEAENDLDQNLAELLDQAITTHGRMVRPELKPLLDLVSELQRLPQPEIDPDHYLSTLLKLGAKIDRARRPSLFQSVWVRSAAGVLLFLVLGLSTSLFSQKSNPGEPLYPVKLLTERIRLFFTVDRAGQVGLRLAFAENRSREFAAELSKTNSVNRRLLASMLSEAAQALDDAADLPDARQQPLIARAQTVNRYQSDILNQAKTRVSADSLVLDRALCACHERMEFLHSTLCPERSPCTINCPADTSGR